MVKPDWNIFRAKFSENPQDNFEWFCYLLFCKEFKKPLGVSGFKNQRHIETNPISVDNEVIGWQAKYYETPLTNHKEEILKLLVGSKKDYPSLTKVLFYTNKAWSQGKNNDPKVKNDIDAEARKLGLKIDWEHMENFFKSPFVSIENENIAKHFFSSDKSVFDVIEAQHIHTESLFKEIQTNITFNNKDIEIDRGGNLATLVSSLSKVMILSGTGGVGKTALIKKYYQKVGNSVAFYMFKAAEFELTNLNELFKECKFQDFIDAHRDQDNKIIVVDSAENLLGLKNSEPFKEFLVTLTENNWRLILTTRENYLENLNYEFFEIYHIAPQNIHINNLNLEELTSISEENSFTLPKDEKLTELIRNPFYLKEYLNHYKNAQNLDYIGFKEKLWSKLICKAKPSREQCFLQIALKRVQNGQFFVQSNFDKEILDNELVKDGILGYESPYGYFITHDIYEEWALEKTIESTYNSKENNQHFFESIGCSLPIRRAFRNWVSEKLQLEDSGIKTFIEGSLVEANIDQSWKDEILISILLSEYSEHFFQIFKEKLLDDDQKLLKRLTFLLRIACKVVNNDYFTQLGIKKVSLFTLKYVLTKPRGKGWECLIKFVFNNVDKVGINNVYFILPIIHDWNSSVKYGETTKYSALIALKYYQWIVAEKVYFSRDDTKDNLLQTIFYGCNEVKDELAAILNEVILNKWKWHSTPYFELSNAILTKLEGIGVAKVLPQETIKLADLFWMHIPKDDDSYHRSGIDIGEYFGMDDGLMEYHPVSAYKTPIYWLLQYAFQDTVIFILNFVNKAVEIFAKSDFAKYEVREVDLHLDNGETMKQYASTRLWCIYRGTQVAPDVLESMHMALEKTLLDLAPKMSSKILESWLLYLLKNSKSTSITAIVTSIVLAYPEKTFNIAKLLFRTKDFFFLDSNRMLLDRSHKDMLLMLKNNYSVNSDNEIFENERIQACDDNHRTRTLEDLMLSEQFFRSDGVSEEDADKHQKELWSILDEYYKKLPKEKDQTDGDRTWRLFLARMDRRFMKPSMEKTKDGTIIHFNPEVEPKLKKYSEDSLQKNSEPMRFSSLKLWANYRLRNDEKYKAYPQYEQNPVNTLSAVREIIIGLAHKKASSEQDAGFYLLNSSIPTDVCSVLLKNNFSELSAKDRLFCKKIIYNAVQTPFNSQYKYQVSDGMQSAILVLPSLLKAYPGDASVIKTSLLLHLFNDHPVDMAGTPFCAFSISSIHTLWMNNFKDAQSILLGYLLLKPKYDNLREQLRKENYKREIYDTNELTAIKMFFKQYKSELNKIVRNEISFNQIGDIKQIDLDILRTAFLLIPLKHQDTDYEKIAIDIISSFLEKLTSKDREDKVDYAVRHAFMEKYAYLLLSVKKTTISTYLKPLLDVFNSSEAIADLLKEIVIAEDYLNTYENFWEIWTLLKKSIFHLGKDGDKTWYVDKIIKSYLFAEVTWKETAKEWRSLKTENGAFFKEISENLGNCPSTLYALSKFLNNIGSSYLNDGIIWIAAMIKNHNNVLSVKIDTNTIYYLENIVRKYIYVNREKIRRTKSLKLSVLDILTFLVEKGSVIGFLLREQIL